MTTPFTIPELLDSICQHLTLFEILLLNKYRIINYKISLSKIITNRLKEIGMSDNGIKSLLLAIRNTKSYISGSFLLSVLFTNINKKLVWKVNTVDIYSNAIFNRNICLYCLRGNYAFSPLEYYFSVFKIKGNENNDRCVICNCFSRYSINCPRMGIVSNRKLKIDKSNIVVHEYLVKNYIPLVDYIFDTNDIDFGKIAYTEYSNGESRLFIDKPESLISKSCIYEGDDNSVKYYDQKKFLTNNLVAPDQIHRRTRIFNNYFNIIPFYRKRGFIINYKFDFGLSVIENRLRKKNANEFRKKINSVTKRKFIHNFTIHKDYSRIIFNSNIEFTSLFPQNIFEKIMMLFAGKKDYIIITKLISHYFPLSSWIIEFDKLIIDLNIKEIMKQ